MTFYFDEHFKGEPRVVFTNIHKRHPVTRIELLSNGRLSVTHHDMPHPRTDAATLAALKERIRLHAERREGR